MIYELRVYNAIPGKMAALNQRFANHTVSLFKKNGINAIGFWEAVIGTNNQLTYMVSFENLAEREWAWASFQQDPDWIRSRTESERDGTLVDHIHNSILRPTSYSPDRFGESAKLCELRVYTATPGKLSALNEQFANRTVPLLEKNGMKLVGFWETVIGTSNQLTWMIAFEDLAQRERLWASFQQDPEWIQARQEGERGGPLVTRINNYILRPTSYSPMQ